MEVVVVQEYISYVSTALRANVCYSNPADKTLY